MDITKVFNYYTDLKNKDVIVSYQGPFTQEIIEGITEIINIKLDKKFITIFIELAQNIIKYSKENSILQDGREANCGIVIIGKKEEKTFIITGNYLSVEQKKIIDDKFKQISIKSNNELDIIYKKQLKAKNTNKLSKGAGLGLIDIKRKSSELTYNIENINKDYFLTIKSICNT